MGWMHKIIAFVQILLGLYLINFVFGIVSFEFLGENANWIAFIAGAILIIHGVRFLFKKKAAY